MKIIWAVDPFTSEKELQTAVAAAIEAFLKESSASVEPVFVAYAFGFPTHFTRDTGYFGGFETVGKAAQKELKLIVDKVRLKRLKGLKLLFEPGRSQTTAVKALIDYAHKANADLIVTGTHARRGPARWVLGSFAETLMLKSDVPLLIVNSHWKRRPRFKHILFPTDFSRESRRAFKRVLELAKLQRAKLTVFHKAVYPKLYSPDATLTTAAFYREEFERDRVTSEKTARKWVDEAKTRGVRADYIIDAKASNSIGEAILKRARREPDLVAIAAQSGLVGATLIGSVARRVVRGSRDPVWVIRTDKI